MIAIIAALLVTGSAGFSAIPRDLFGLGLSRGSKPLNRLFAAPDHATNGIVESAAPLSVDWAEVTQYESSDGLPTLVPFVDVMTTENKQALDNIAQVCGLNREWLERQSNSIWQHFLPWKQCECDSDLFITELGTFDLSKAYATILQRRQVDFWVDLVKKYASEDIVTAWCRIYGITWDGIEDDDIRELVSHAEFDPHKELAAAMRRGVLFPEGKDTEYSAQLQQSILEGRMGPLITTPFWYVKPVDLQLMGYFDEWADDQTDVAVIIAQPEDCPQRRHFINFYDGWNSGNGFIGKLVASLDHVPRWPSNWDSLPPERLLKQLPGLDDWFSHLDDLPDGGRLVVLRSCHHIKQIGIDYLDSSVGSEDYPCMKQAKEGEIVLVALYETAASVKPHAVGEFRCADREWYQMQLHDGETAPDEIRDEYEEFTPIIETLLDGKI